MHKVLELLIDQDLDLHKPAKNNSLEQISKMDGNKIMLVPYEKVEKVGWHRNELYNRWDKFVYNRFYD